MLIPLTFIILAAICNAVMDTLDFHFETSVFKNANPKFWNPQVSWKYCKVIGGYHVDGWHIVKSLMVIFIALAIKRSWEMIIIGFVWDVIFTFFFDVILNNEKHEDS